eukprot:9871334-Lingulodinium_polyedra.AAC.1
MVEPAATVQDTQSTEPASSQEPATSQLVFPVSQTDTTPSPTVPSSSCDTSADVQMGCGDAAEAATAAPASSAASSGPSDATGPAAAAGPTRGGEQVEDAKLRTRQECKSRHHYKAV